MLAVNEWVQGGGSLALPLTQPQCGITNDTSCVAPEASKRRRELNDVWFTIIFEIKK